MEDLPSDFSGLLFRPGEENAVYLLMGLLWDYLPYQFAFEEFEVNPRERGYDHSKWLDARGKQFKNGEWVKVNFEFKLKSSGLLRDIDKHPNLCADFLVCWEHDSPEAEKYVDEVISLKEIYYNLSEDEKESIILKPKQVGKPSLDDVPVDELLERFSDENRPKVEHLCDIWADAHGGHTEIIFPWGGETLFRANPGVPNHLTARKSPLSDDVKQVLLEKFGAVSQDCTIRVPLNPLDIDDLDSLIELIRE